MTNALSNRENSHLPVHSQKLKSVGELKELLIDYAPNKQVIFCRDKELCYFGQSPTLAEINRDYDPLAARAFIIPQLTDIAKFSNCTNILKAEQIRECADMITVEYYYLKLSEFMLFCWKFKNGEYGQFYGSVSPMTILCSLRSFTKDRSIAIESHESRLRGEEREREKQKFLIIKRRYTNMAKEFLDYFNTIVSIISWISLTNKKKYNNDENQVTKHCD